MKKVFILFIIIGLLLFVFYQPSKISLEGNWTANEISFDGKKINLMQPLIKISDWEDSLHIIDRNLKTSAKIMIKYNKLEKPYVVLSSKEEFLNGTFDLKIDTILKKLDSKNYIISIKLVSSKTYIHFQRSIYEKNQNEKVTFPRRGMP